MIPAMAREKDRTKPARRPRADSLDTARDAPNPVWFKPLMFGFMIVGLIWVIVFYVSQGTLLRDHVHRVPDDHPVALTRTPGQHQEAAERSGLTAL
jgi:hypothetical protein